MHRTIPMRASTKEIIEKRKNRRTTFFLTGGTGFLGSHLAVELLREGHKVILLSRSSKGLSGRERVLKLLNWFDLESQYRSHLEVLEGSLDSPHLDLSEEDYGRLLRDVDEIIHCASNTSFSERKRDEVTRVNINNLHHILALASQGNSSFFHLISTAYVAGKKTGICEETFVDTNEFNNVYEETKYIGERLSLDNCREHGIRLNIYRPSIVYGNSKNGKSLSFNAVYYPVKNAFFLKKIYEQDIREAGGKQAEALGVSLGKDDVLYVPLRIEVSQGGGINLIPIDYFTQAFIAIMEESLEDDVFHIVNNRLKTIEEIIEYTQALFHLNGIHAAPKEEFEKNPRNAMELLFQKYLEVYRPYMLDKKIFVNTKAASILEKGNVCCPDFDFGVFSRCMNYGVATDWGASLFKNT